MILGRASGNLVFLCDFVHILLRSIVRLLPSSQCAITRSGRVLQPWSWTPTREGMDGPCEVPATSATNQPHTAVRAPTARNKCASSTRGTSGTYPPSHWARQRILMWCFVRTAQSTQRPRQSSSRRLQKMPFPRSVKLLRCYFDGQWNMAETLNSSTLEGVGNRKIGDVLCRDAGSSEWRFVARLSRHRTSPRSQERGAAEDNAAKW